MQQLGLTTSYSDNQAVRQAVKRLMALAFVQAERVPAAFTELKDDAPSSLQQLLLYFEQQWLVNVPLTMWNVHNKDIRTNNDCEGWHHRFNKLVNKHHPNVWHIFKCIVEEQSATEVLLCQISAGQCVKNPLRKYTACNKRLQKLLQKYLEGTITVIQYIDGVAYNINV